VILSFQRSRRSELHTLRGGGASRKPTRPLRHELGYLHQASYCGTLIEQTTETQTPLAGNLRIIPGIYSRASPKAAAETAHRVCLFELKLLHALGLAPDIDDSQSFRRKTRGLVTALTKNGLGKLSGFACEPLHNSPRPCGNSCTDFLSIIWGKFRKAAIHAVE